MERAEKELPGGVAHDIIFDTTPFIRESVNEVYKTLGYAVILVALVVLVFLQNWRSALIPLLAVRSDHRHLRGHGHSGFQHQHL